MKQVLSLKVSQHLTLTPQLQQSIRLLQLSTLELGQEVEQALDENPFLERVDEQAEREDFGLEQADAPVSLGDRVSEIATESIAIEPGFTGTDTAFDAEPAAAEADETPSWEGDGTAELRPDDSEWGADAPPRGTHADNEDETDYTARLGGHVSLQDHLHRQALRMRLSAEDAAALRFLIESLNDDGYLSDSLEDLAQSLAGDDAQAHDELLHRFTVALGLLQSLDPVGVGARNLGECLQLQLRERLAHCPPHADASAHPLLQLALRMCAQPMELLARRDIKTLVLRCGGTDVQVREALALIARLEPKPARQFSDVERNAVVPDVLVVPVQRQGAASTQFRVMLNADVMPRLRVHDVYASVLRNQRGVRDAAGHAALQQQLQEARWFIKNIQQRFDTILRVSRAIVERQKGFFTHGELAMRPLVLREIADELGLHESTISRVTTAKYMSTPFGTFELKYFFGSGLGTESGGNASSTAVRALIKQFIAAEDPHKPLSDNQIADMLKEQGIDCARRTVAKYREGLKIAVASLRKAL
ncbi:MAG: RNA polymerase factor sigma-54 [Rhodoferax sp.]